MGLFGKKPRAQVDRPSRIRLLGSDKARFECKQGIFAIRNLSESGVGLQLPSDIEDESLEGILFFGEHNCPVVLDVAYCKDGILGARFSDASVVRGMLRRFFGDESNASTMSEVGTEKLSLPVEGKPRWFYSPANYELFFVEDKNEIIRLDLDLNGKFFSASKDHALRVGLVMPENRSQPAHTKSLLVNWMDKVVLADQQKAERVIENIPGLTAEERKKLQALLSF